MHLFSTSIIALEHTYYYYEHCCCIRHASESACKINRVCLKNVGIWFVVLLVYEKKTRGQFSRASEVEINESTLTLFHSPPIPSYYILLLLTIDIILVIIVSRGPFTNSGPSRHHGG